MTTAKRLLDVTQESIGRVTVDMFLKAARTAKAMSQIEMARYLGITRGTLCDIEKGRQLVSPTLAAKIAKKAGLSTTLAVKACLQDQLDKAKIKLIVDLKAS